MPSKTNKTSVSLYKGSVEIDFYPDSHRYKKPNEKSYLISATAATGILDKSRFLIPWAVNLAGSFLKLFLEENAGPFHPNELLPVIEEALIQHTVKKEEAADIGSQVHSWIEGFIKAKINKTEIPTLDGIEDEKVLNGINGFLDWYNSHDVQFLASERLIYSVKNDYCGLTDFVAIVDGNHVVGDFKTGKNIYTEHYYQLSAYWKAVEEEDGKEFDQGIILHVNKETGAFNAMEVSKEANELNFPVFLACLTIKRREKELAKW